MFPSTSTPSTSSSRKEIYPNSTPLSQVYPQEQSFTANFTQNTRTGTTNPTNVAATPSTAARTYKTREKLYYETDYVKSNSPANNNNTNASNSSAIPANSSLFEPFLRKQAVGGEEVSQDDLPPTASLHDNLLPAFNNNNNSASTASSAFANLCSGSPMVINGVIGSPMKKNTEPSATQWSSVFVPGGAKEMTRSVTVFGFPPNCRSEILISFQGHGPIESFDSAGEGGSNWLHIVYESEWAAQKALNRNGSIFQGSMIGVIPMQNALERVNNAANSFMSPIKKQHQMDGEEESIFAKKDASSKNKQKVDLASLPSESSLVTKAVNYIFGW